MENRKQTILIVDDEPGNIEILSEALGDDYEILFAVSGKEALEIASRQMPDLIILDIVMPVMSGYEVLLNLKQNQDLREIPVIFITALDQEDQETKGFMLGAVDYIPKPFNPTIVKLRIRTQLELKLQRDLLKERNEELEKALQKIKNTERIAPYLRIMQEDTRRQRILDAAGKLYQRTFGCGIHTRLLSRLYEKTVSRIIRKEIWR